jgi:hypothetical protein
MKKNIIVVRKILLFTLGHKLLKGILLESKRIFYSVKVLEEIWIKRSFQVAYLYQDFLTNYRRKVIWCEVHRSIQEYGLQFNTSDFNYSKNSKDWISKIP